MAVLALVASCDFLTPAPERLMLAFALAPPPALVEGDTFTVQVDVLDARGDPAAGFSGAVTLALAGDSSGAALLGKTTVHASGGMASFAGLSLDRAGTGYLLAASAEGLAPDTTGPIEVTGPAVALRFTKQPNDMYFHEGPGWESLCQTHQCSSSFAVSAVDGMGSVVKAFGDTVRLTLGQNPVGQFLDRRLPAENGTANGQVTLKRAAGYTLVASSGALPPVESEPFTSYGDYPTLLGLYVPYPAPAAGDSFHVEVALIGGGGVAGEISGGDVLLSVDSVPPGGAIAGPTHAPILNGRAVFPGMVATVAGRYVLSAVGWGFHSALVPLNIVDAPAAAIAFAAPQPTRSPGSAFPVAIEIRSAGGHRTNAYSGSVSLALGVHPPGAVLGGTLTVGVTSGLAVFPDVTLDRPGVGYTLVASAPGLEPGESSRFNVSGLALAFSALPLVIEAGVLPEVVVEARDSAGNRATGFADSVTLRLAEGPPGTAVGGTTTAVAAAGDARFTDLRLTVAGGGYRLWASSAGAVSDTSGEFAIGPSGGARPIFLIQPEVHLVGSPGAPRVEATIAIADSFGNLGPLDTPTTDTVIVRLAPHPSGSDSLFGPYQGVVQDGRLPFSAPRPWVPDSGYRLVVDEAGAADTSDTFVVTARGQATMTPSTQPPDTVVLGTPFSVAFTVVDADGYPLPDTAAMEVTLWHLADQGFWQNSGVLATVSHTRGLAVFPNLIVASPGTYRLEAHSLQPWLQYYLVAETNVFTVVASSGPP